MIYIHGIEGALSMRWKLSKKAKGRVDADEVTMMKIRKYDQMPESRNHCNRLSSDLPFSDDWG